MRKVDIRARVGVLNEALQRRKATPASQHEERQRLVQACADAGDHVPVSALDANVYHAGGFHYRCDFCGVQLTTSRNQISRGLVIA